MRPHLAAAARLHQVLPGIHAWVQPDGSWWVNNAGAVVDDNGVLVIDTCASAVRTRRFLAALDTATGGVPVRMAINTHQHGDHTYGNSLLPPTTVIIGHGRMREGLRVDPDQVEAETKYGVLRVREQSHQREGTDDDGHGDGDVHAEQPRSGAAHRQPGQHLQRGDPVAGMMNDRHFRSSSLSRSLP